MTVTGEYYRPRLDKEIAAYLRSTGKTQSQMAEELDMADYTFSCKRRGVRDFTLTEAEKICEKTELSLDVATGRAKESEEAVA